MESGPGPTPTKKWKVIVKTVGGFFHGLEEEYHFVTKADANAWAKLHANRGEMRVVPLEQHLVDYYARQQAAFDKFYGKESLNDIFEKKRKSKPPPKEKSIWDSFWDLFD